MTHFLMTYRHLALNDLFPYHHTSVYVNEQNRTELIMLAGLGWAKPRGAGRHTLTGLGVAVTNAPEDMLDRCPNLPDGFSLR